MTLHSYSADLHIHTLLSPCGWVEMIPRLIIEATQAAGLDIIGIADHNSCENAGAVIEAAHGSGVKVIPGLEVMSVEGVHLLCLFDDLDLALAMQETVYDALPNVPGAAKFVDEQFVVDSEGEFLRYCERPISLPTMLEIERIWARANELGGMCIPSHIDRPSTGMCGVLGMMPESPSFEAIEISHHLDPDSAREKHPSIGSLPVFQSSDSHWLEMIGSRRTVLKVEHRTLAEIRMACRNEGERRVGA